MSYYFRLLEIIENQNGEKITGRKIQDIYIKKFKEGNAVNINRSLKQVRKKDYNNGIKYEKCGKSFSYWVEVKNNKYKKQ